MMQLKNNDWWVYLIFCIFLTLALTRPLFGWWLEDDVYQRTFILKLTNPVDIFWNSHAMFGFDMGRTFVPLLAFSEYIDSLIYPFSPIPANIHNMVVFGMTACVLFHLLSKISSQSIALSSVILWMLLPSSILISEWIAVRHYLEGFLFSLVSIAAVMNIKSSDEHNRHSRALWACFFFFLAAISKEIYVTFTFYLIFVLLWRRKFWAGMVYVFVTGLLYSLYRFYYFKGVNGGDFSFNLEQLKHFVVLPLTFTGDYSGAFAFIILCLLSLVIIIRYYSYRSWLIILGGVFCLVFPLIPVMTHLHHAPEPGTWYRLVFLLNSVFLLGSIHLIHLLDHKVMKRIVFFGSLVIISIGGIRMANKLDQLREAYHEESMFYLNNPDKLLFSEVPYAQYISNIHDLFCPNQKRHYIDWLGLMDKGVIHSLLKEKDAVWIYTDQGYRKDPLTLQRIMMRNIKRTYPLSQPGPRL
jgi:hypothetical protein